MRALSLTEAALTATVAIYHQRCAQLAIERRLGDLAFADVLNLAVLFSQRVAEGRKLRLTLLVPSEDIDLAHQVQKERTCGVVDIPLPDAENTESVFSTLEPYLGCASDQFSLFVIQPTDGSAAVRLSLLYFGTPLTSSPRRRCEPASITALIQRSITIRVEYGTVSVGVGLDWFVTLQQGELLEIPRFEREINAILAASGSFRTRLGHLLAEPGSASIPGRVALVGGPASIAAAVSEGAIRRAISEALREIIATIAQANHGSTLLFGTQSSLQDTLHYQPGALDLDLPLGETVLRQFEVLRDTQRLAGDVPGQGQGESCDPELGLAVERTAANIRAIINLSQSDGAVVFDGDLTVIGSSTFLKVKESAVVAGGARRKSAQSFVRAHPGVVAVVISQDGFVSLVS